jgi:hypothetical protein
VLSKLLMRKPCVCDRQHIAIDFCASVRAAVQFDAGICNACALNDTAWIQRSIRAQTSLRECD